MANRTLEPIMRYLKRRAAATDADARTDRQLLERYRTQRDEAAFTALVRRHGQIVLSACRQVLIEPADIEDAFQATFLVLVRKVGKVRWHASIGNWLFGVAHRVAVRARANAQRRKLREAGARRSTNGSGSPLDPSWREAVGMLHEELDRLPDKFRVPLLLCYLCGKSRDEAAAQMGLSASTIKGRLELGRKRLHVRLARRGIDLSAGLLAVLAAEPARAAAYTLVNATVRLASGGVPSAAVTALVQSGMGTVATIKMAAGSAILAIGLLVAGTGAALAPVGDSPTEKKPMTAKQPARIATNADANTVSGRVLGPDGKPVAGAKLFIVDYASKAAAPQPAADADGRFRFALDAADAPGSRLLLARTDGLGTDWARLSPSEVAENLTLRLPLDVPILGKVVDLEGRPVAGAVVDVVELTTTESGNLDEFMKRWAADKEKLPTGPTFHLLTEKSLWPQEALRELFAAKTGPDGTYRLAGIGRDRGVMLRVRGLGIADHYVRLLTRPDFQPTPAREGQVALSGPELTAAVSPSKPILGIVRDARTKQPVANIRVLAYTPDRPIHWWWQPIETVTDAQGRYRLDGLAKTARQIVLCDPGAGAVHMHRFDQVGDSAGFEPITHDTELHRGVVVSGQVTDRSTGRPVRAHVVYCPLINNGNFTTTPGYARPRTQLILWIQSREMTTGIDGRYRLTALPGPGVLFVRAVANGSQYTPPALAKEDADPAIFHEHGEVFATIGMGDIHPLSGLHGYRVIRPAADATGLTADFALDPGLSRKGRLIDPEGRPLSGTQAFNLSTRRGSAPMKQPQLPRAEFTAEALNPSRPRRLLFWHDQRKLSGTVVLRGDEPEPVTVTLNPLAALTGRAVLRTTGEPLVGFSVEYSAWPELGWPPQNKNGERTAILTDKDGRFRVTDLPSGVPLTLSLYAPKSRYAIIHIEKITLQPGETKDLGDRRGVPESNEP